MTQQIQRHCIFARYGRSKDDNNSDVLLVKERLRDPVTGKEKPHVRLVYNYKRPFGITKKPYRNHQQKKEWEWIDKLDIYECTQAELPRRIAKLTNQGGFKSLNQLCQNPYIYGTDVSSAVIYTDHMKRLEEKHNEGWSPLLNVAVMDYETDVDRDNKVLWMGGVSFKDKALIVVTEEYAQGLNPDTLEEQTNALARKLLKQDMEERHITLKVRIAETPAKAVIELIRFCHITKPDIVAFWNSGFDIKVMINALESEGYDPADVFSDPCVPKAFRKFRFTEGSSNRVTASGKKQNFGNEEKWHRVDCLASFQIICAMATYRLLRAADGGKRSYGLDFTLENEIGIRKLEYECPEAPGDQHGTGWHRVMAAKYKIPYMVYNIFDCISVERLDEHTTDLCRNLSIYLDGSEFSQAKSNPRRLGNALHFYLLDQGKLIASTSDDMREPFDKKTLNKRGWIVTLANELTHSDIGAKIWLPEYRTGLKSRIAVHMWDVDVSSGYPSGEIAANVGRGTCLAEVFRVDGYSEQELRRLSVNMSVMPANALWMGSTFLQLPDATQLIQFYKEEQKKQA